MIGDIVTLWFASPLSFSLLSRIYTSISDLKKETLSPSKKI
jgi:hypothetical protein